MVEQFAFKQVSCLHTPPGYHSPAPPRCVMAHGHEGAHKSNAGMGGEPLTWPNEEESE